jgi:hypothetical protein
MENPHAMLGQANGEPLDICNVATNADQGKRVFFKKLASRLARPCFAEWEPQPSAAKISFKRKEGLTLHSLHSQNEGWEGMNILAWVMDEASAFRTANGGDNAENVYNTLKSSTRSRFGHLHSIGMIISFPRKQEGDFTLTQWERSKTSDNFGDRAATWEVHPRWEPGHPMYQPESDKWIVIPDLNVRVPAEFKEDFENDGADALTKYMAQPPVTEGGFFENPHALTEAVNDKLPPLVTKVSEREEMLDNGIVRRYIRHEIESLPPVIEGASYFIHGDPGLKKDAFSLAVAHTLPDYKTISDGGGKQVEVQKVVVDFLLTWEPKPRKPVDLLNVDEIIMFLAKHYDVKRVTFDRWNSAQSIQALVAYGIDADDMTFSTTEQYLMYRYLRLSLYNNMIELPVDDALQNELKFLKDKNGKIDHDLYGKDRADAVAAVVWNAAHPQRTARSDARWEGFARGGSECSAKVRPAVVSSVLV